MAVVLQYCKEGEPVPHNAIRAPGCNDTFVVVNGDKSPSAFGCGKACEDGGSEAWFPWGGKVEHKYGSFSFLIKNPAYVYMWVLADKVLAHQNRKFKTVEVDRVCPASFAGRLGKVQLIMMTGWTCWRGLEVIRNVEEVTQAHLLCARRKHDECYVDYHPLQVGRYPPADAVQAKDCLLQSYVVLSREFAEPATFGRASLNAHRDGLQAWFPYCTLEYERDKFEVLRHLNCMSFYWTPIAEVDNRPGLHEVVRVGEMSPAVINGILGKARISDLRGWTSYGGREIDHDRNEVLAGKVLCYKDHHESLPA